MEKLENPATDKLPGENKEKVLITDDAARRLAAIGFPDLSHLVHPTGILELFSGPF